MGYDSEFIESMIVGRGLKTKKDGDNTTWGRGLAELLNYKVANRLSHGVTRDIAPLEKQKVKDK